MFNKYHNPKNDPVFSVSIKLSFSSPPVTSVAVALNALFCFVGRNGFFFVTTCVHPGIAIFSACRSDARGVVVVGNPYDNANPTNTGANASLVILSKLKHQVTLSSRFSKFNSLSQSLSVSPLFAPAAHRTRRYGMVREKKNRLIYYILIE